MTTNNTNRINSKGQTTLSSLKRRKSGNCTFFTFYDLYDKSCSIQESSVCGDNAIWIGVDSDMDGNQVVRGRMHLTQTQVKAILPILQHFVETGNLKKIKTTK